VAGTGITVDDTDPANPIVTATGGGGGAALTIVTITDAAVSMVANTRYEGSIAAFTADRNYTLPAGTAGDVIEVALTTGDDAFEIILLGASGVSINGGTAATEWSRLFISNEFVRFRCHATNDWRVEIDGRVPQHCELFLTTDIAGHFVDNAYTKIPFDTTAIDNASIGSLANDTITPRRNGKYAIGIKVRGGNTSGVDAVTLNINGVQELLTVEGPVANGPGRTLQRLVPSIVAGHVVFAEYYQSSGGNVVAVGSATLKPNMLSLYEVF
jgi:hypothetical protein